MFSFRLIEFATAFATSFMYIKERTSFPVPQICGDSFFRTFLNVKGITF